MSERLEKVKAGRGAPAARERAEIERGLEQLSYLLDGLFRVPGTQWRVGLDALVGLVPGVGDFATTAASLYIMAAGVRYGVPKVTLLRMGANVAIDYLLGSVPVVGDLFDAAWKSNQKNIELLRERAAVSGAEARRARASDWLFLALIVVVLLALLVGSVVFSLWLLSLVVGSIPSPSRLFG
jgi:nitrate reductase NapE component